MMPRCEVCHSFTDSVTPWKRGVICPQCIVVMRSLDVFMNPAVITQREGVAMNYVDRVLWFLVCTIALIYENIRAALRYRVILVSPQHDVAVMHKAEPVTFCVECTNGYGELFSYSAMCERCDHTKVMR